MSNLPVSHRYQVTKTTFELRRLIHKASAPILFIFITAGSLLKKYTLSSLALPSFWELSTAPIKFTDVHPLQGSTDITYSETSPDPLSSLVGSRAPPLCLLPSFIHCSWKLYICLISPSRFWSPNKTVCAFLIFVSPVPSTGFDYDKYKNICWLNKWSCEQTNAMTLSLPC